MVCGLLEKGCQTTSKANTHLRSFWSLDTLSSQLLSLQTQKEVTSLEIFWKELHVSNSKYLHQVLCNGKCPKESVSELKRAFQVVAEKSLCTWKSADKKAKHMHATKQCTPAFEKTKTKKEPDTYTPSLIFAININSANALKSRNWVDYNGGTMEIPLRSF